MKFLSLLVACLVGALFTDHSTSSVVHKHLSKEVEEKLKTMHNAVDEIRAVNTDVGVVNQLFQSDMKVSEEELEELHSGKIPMSLVLKRNAMRYRYYIWRLKRIPFEFDSAIQSTGTTNIEAAIKKFNDNTCIKWEPKTDSDTKWIKFVKDIGCWSWVGKTQQTGAQELSIGEGCNHVATIEHEMMHATGFFHEQARYDRDEFITINYQNIKDGMASQFDKQSLEAADTMDLAYDFDSVMHYGSKDFSKNGLPTIQDKSDPSKQLGQDVGLSSLDIEKLNKYYDCSSPVDNAWSSWSPFGPCKLYSDISKCYKLRQRFCTKESVSACPGADNYGIENNYLQVSCPCS